jgi:hypothetical protein
MDFYMEAVSHITENPKSKHDLLIRTGLKSFTSPKRIQSYPINFVNNRTIEYIISSIVWQ